MEADPVPTPPADIETSEDQIPPDIADDPVDAVENEEPGSVPPPTETPAAADDNTIDGANDPDTAPVDDNAVEPAPPRRRSSPPPTVDVVAARDAAEWLDTGAGNSMRPDDSQFKTLSVGNTSVFGTSSEANNIHSHFVNVESSNWKDYTFIGRMMISDPAGGIGVTFLSDYPNSDTYYRIRSVSGSTFHVAPHPWDVITITEGTTDSNVAPLANKWYRFRIQVEDDQSRTLIRARLWQEGKTEPAKWQINCLDNSPNRLTCGTIGVWSHGPGLKYWDDLEAIPGQVDGSVVTPPPAPDPVDSGTSDDPVTAPALPATIVNGVYHFTGQLGTVAFNIYTDQNISWWFYDVVMDGAGEDSTLFAVGKDCRIERATIFGGKHGIRMASVDGLSVRDSDISCTSLLGHGIKLCGIGDRGPSSRNVTIENCDIRGDVAIRPMNIENALLEKIENVTLRNCTIKPYGNVGVGIAAKNVRCENVTIDFREADGWVKGCTGFDVTDYYGCMPQNVTITDNCRMLLRAGQTGELIVSNIPINSR